MLYVILNWALIFVPDNPSVYDEIDSDVIKMRYTFIPSFSKPLVLLYLTKYVPPRQLLLFINF